jgi:hypothetical protein
VSEGKAKKEANMPRIVYATCEPEGNPHSVYIVRQRFLDAIENYAPQVLDELRKDPFQAYDQHRPILLWDFDQDAITVDRRDLKGIQQISDAVKHCLEGHRILTDWLFVCTLLTLQEWVFERVPHQTAKWPDCRQKHNQSPWWMNPLKPKQAAVGEAERVFRFEYGCPDPTLFPYQDKKERASIESQIREQFEIALKKHLDGLARIPVGFVEVLNKDDDRHLEWLVQNRINKLSPEDIQVKFASHVDVQTIKKGIRTAEKLVGLPTIRRRGGSRPGPRNRPKGNKSRKKSSGNKTH